MCGVHVCVVCMRVGLHVDGYICVHMRMGVPRLVSGIIYSSATLLTEAGSHSQTQSSQIWLVLLASVIPQ